MSLSSSIILAMQSLASDPLFWLVGGVTICLIAASKGAFGGGVASIGVPMLSLITDPIGAAIIVAPLISMMDMFTLRTFGPSSWSKPDLRVLLPGLLAGIGLGWWALTRVNPHLVALLIGLISVIFAVYWFVKRARKDVIQEQPVQPALGFVAGTASGFTTFIAHAGGPPVAMYLIRRQLGKTLFVGTNTAFFTLGNILKLGPYGILMVHRPDCAAAALLLAPLIPLSVWVGLDWHKRLSYEGILLATNLILIVGGARLIWQGAVGFFG